MDDKTSILASRKGKSPQKLTKEDVRQKKKVAELKDNPLNWGIKILEVYQLPHHPELYDYNYKRLQKPATYAQIASGEAVKLGTEYVHKEEAEHAKEHAYFCRVLDCKYHLAY